MASKYENYTKPVSISKTVSVYPKILHPQKVLSLSNLDRQCPTLMYLVFFYNSTTTPSDGHKTLSFGSVFDSLKSGLEETLSIWYPAAGRLSLNPIDGKLNLWCNNKGALLVEAITEANIADLGDLTHYDPFYEKLVFKPLFNADFSDMPLVVAQVTKFGCGGYSIGVGTSHSLFDGPAAYNFLSAWASNSVAINIKQNNKPLHDHHQRLFEPVHERASLLLLANDSQAPAKGLINHRNPLTTTNKVHYNYANNKNNNSNYQVKQTGSAAAIDHLLQLIMQAAAQGNLHDTSGSTVSSSNQKGFVFKTFHLSGSLVETLKTQVFQDAGFSCSSFEVVAALLWKTRTKAMGLRKETTACLQFAVDTRAKVAPPLPAGFSGNAFVLASVALAAGELEKLSHKAIIAKIREAKDLVNNDYVKAYMEGLQGPQASLPPLKELTLISDWTRMPFHDLRFFPAPAAASYVSPLVPPIPQVAYFMPNPNDHRAVDLRIGLLPENLDAFSYYFLAATTTVL